MSLGKRRKAREAALQALYQIDVAGHSADEALQSLRESFGETDTDVLGYAEMLIRGVADNRDELDALGFKLRLTELEQGAVNIVVQPGQWPLPRVDHLGLALDGDEFEDAPHALRVELRSNTA